jgi:HSP20 family protein
MARELARRNNLSSHLWGDMFNEFDSAIESYLGSSMNENAMQISCDVSETKDSYKMCFDVPGVKQEDINIDVQGHQLTVSGERKSETDVKDQHGLRHERSYGKFERSFTLPEGVDLDKVEAAYENGVLNLTIPKAEKAMARKIQIGSGSGVNASKKESGLLGKFMGGKKEEETPPVQNAKPEVKSDF